MKTRNLFRKPGHPRPHFPAGRPVAQSQPVPTPGDWRYTSVAGRRWSLLIAAVAAATVHGAMFYTFPPKPAAAPAVARPVVENTLQIALPALPPEPDEQMPRELTESPAEAIATPQLADVPSSVALSDFTQTVDLRPSVQVDSATLKSMTIPVVRGRGGPGLGGNGSIFSLSQLDRVPQPIAQPAPSLPRNVRPELSVVVITVEFIVDAEGRVIEPRVTRADAPGFEREAIQGVSRWKFRPGMLGGRKVATRMEVPLRFEIKNGE